MFPNAFSIGFIHYLIFIEFSSEPNGIVSMNRKPMKLNHVERIRIHLRVLFDSLSPPAFILHDSLQ